MTIIASIITLSNPKQSTTGSVSTVTAASKFGSNSISCGGSSGSSSGGLLGNVLGGNKGLLGGLLGNVLGGSGPNANVGINVGAGNNGGSSTMVPMNGGSCGCN